MGVSLQKVAGLFRVLKVALSNKNSGKLGQNSGKQSISLISIGCSAAAADAAGIHLTEGSSHLWWGRTLSYVCGAVAMLPRQKGAVLLGAWPGEDDSFQTSTDLEDSGKLVMDFWEWFTSNVMYPWAILVYHSLDGANQGSTFFTAIISTENGVNCSWFSKRCLEQSDQHLIDWANCLRCVSFVAE